MTSYWLSNFCALYSSLNIIPFIGNDKNFQYNSLTRLIIFVTIISYIYTQDINVILAGIASVTISAIIYFLTFNTKSVENLSEKYLDKNETSIDKIIKDDNTINQQNQITLDYSPPDTDDLRKHVYFLEGDKSKDTIVPVDINSSDLLPSGPRVTYGITKSLSNLNRNI
jgi:hypothetical protein